MLHELILVRNLNCRQAADPRKKTTTKNWRKCPNDQLEWLKPTRCALSFKFIHSTPVLSSRWLTSTLRQTHRACEKSAYRFAPVLRLVRGEDVRAQAVDVSFGDLWIHSADSTGRQVLRSSLLLGLVFWILKTSVTLWLWRAYCEQSSHHGEMD